MKFALMLSAALTGLTVLVCPTARAEPTPEDYYSKRLSGYGVNYQGRYTFDEIVQEGQRVCALLEEVVSTETLQNARQRLVDQLGFSSPEASGIVDSAVQSFCDQHSQLVMDSGIMTS